MSESPQEVTVFGAEWCGDCRRTSRQLQELGVAYTYVDVDADDAGREKALEIAGRRNIPVVLFSDGDFLVEPSNPELLSALRARKIVTHL